MNDIDIAKSKFELFKKEIKKFIKQDISESDTRSKVIDYLLKDILGWNEQDIIREKHGSSGYYDYKVSIPGFNFLIEAKKNFNEFEFPTKHRKSLVSSIYKSNKEVIDQIRKYSFDHGIQYGVLTNGKQFIVLKLYTTDGSDWRKKQCLLFSDIEDIEDDFVMFYNNLSKYAVINNSGFEFDILKEEIRYKTILSNLVDRDKELIRNSMSAKISSIIDSIFGEIFISDDFDDQNLIEECFVENNEIKKNRNEIQRLFSDTNPELSEVIPARNYSSIKTQIGEEINSQSESENRYLPPKPIIIIGSKGAGKTTFIKHLFYDKYKYKISKDHVVTYIDLRKILPGNLKDLDKKISETILDDIYAKYADLNLHSIKVLKRIYSEDLNRKDEGEWSYFKSNNRDKYEEKVSEFLEDSKKDIVRHLEKVNKHLIKDRRKRLIVIIDNADQFDEKIQESVFLFSHSLSKSAYCGIIFSLREGYYYKWRNSPPFDAYESNVYHITAPDYSEVLQKRINYALKKIELDGKSKGELKGGKKVTLNNNDVVNFLMGLKNSMFMSQNSDIIEFLSYTTFPNIREGLKVFKSFLISGHTQVDEYIIREKFRDEEGKKYSTIPIHEFIKSIGLQNKLYYNSDISYIYI